MAGDLAGLSAGQAFVEIRARFERFGEDVKSGMAKAAGGAEAEANSRFANVGKAALVGLASVGAVAAGIGAAAIEAADKFETAHARLVTALKNTGTSFEAVKGQVDAVNSRMEKLGFTNTDTESAFAKLQAATKNTAKTVADMALAADVARGRNIDLSAATDLVTKVETGHVAQLGRLGIAVKDASGHIISQAEALKRLSDLYGGQASAYSETFAGKMQTLKTVGEDLTKNLGLRLIPVLEKVGLGALAAAQYIEANWPKVKAVVAGVVDWFAKTALPAMARATKPVTDAIAKLVAAVRADWPEIQTIVGAVVRVVEALWNRFGGRLVDVAKLAFETVVGVVKASVEIVRGIIDTVLALLTGHWSKAWQGIQEIVHGVWDTITALVGGAAKTVVDLLAAALPALGRLAELAWSGFEQAARKGIGTALGLIGNLPGDILRGLGALDGLLITAGEDLIKGLIKGMKNLAKDAVDAVKSVAKDVVKGAKSLLGISSPSTVFAEIGDNMMRGIVVGIDRTSQHVAGSLGRALGSTVPMSSTPLAAGSTAASLSATGRPSAVWAAPATAAGPSVNVTVNGVVGDAHQVAAKITSLLDGYFRSGGAKPSWVYPGAAGVSQALQARRNSRA